MVKLCPRLSRTAGPRGLSLSRTAGPRGLSLSRTAGTLAALSLLLAAGPMGRAQTAMTPAPPPPLQVGTRAPEFLANTVTGQPLSLRSLRGHVVLLDFWATWCGPCRQATPTLEALHRRFGPKGLRVVGMSVDGPGSVNEVPAFLKRFGVTYTITVSPSANQGPARAYRVDAIPSQYLIDKRGIVRWSQSGYSPSEGAELARLIRTYQSQGTASKRSGRA